MDAISCRSLLEEILWDYIFQTPKAATGSPALSDMDRKRPQSSSPTSEAAKRPKVAAAPSPPKERRKKSLPVRKLLEMERSQGKESYRRQKKGTKCRQTIKPKSLN